MGFLKVNASRFSFLICVSGVLGSLYFSEVLKLPPCVLCWYQRICLYPLVLIFGAALWTDARDYRKYLLPLLFFGLAVSAYHNLLYFGFIAETLAPCTKELSCTAKQLELFGFLTIPTLSFLGFLSVAMLTGIDANSRKVKS